ncbi:hypothetical protein [Sorangium sp. So ce1000]|uniref:hypothetical protein n=1 Tax=Sorangium sp. So ce1000 TaxID=3133325 RepID=UPI003F5EC989
MNRSFERIALLVGLSVIPTVAGCSDEPSEEERRFARLAARAEQVRELSFRRTVPVSTITRGEFEADQEAAAAAAEEADLAEMAATYGRLGYFAVDADLRATLARSRDWAGAWYSLESEEIVLIGDVDDAVLIHEYVHGLQDQHFDLAPDQDDALTSDAFLARRAVAEGDATLAEGRFVMQERYDADLHLVDWGPLLSSVHARREELLAGSELPLFFMAYPSFAYSFGLEYCAHNLTGVSSESPFIDRLPPFDWSNEDALFTTRAPASTQQILTLDAQDPAVGVGLNEIPSALGERLEQLDWDTLGEWLTYLLLRPLDGTPDLGDARALAAAWDGDRALFVRDRKTEAVGTAWASAWDDAGAAAALESALWQLYGGSPIDGEEPRLGRASDGELLWIERREERVVALKNIDEALMPSLAEAAFPSGIRPMRLTMRTRPSLAARLSRHLPGRHP